MRKGTRRARSRDAEGEDDADADGDSYMEEDGTPPYAVRAYPNNANGNVNGGGEGNAHLRRAAVPASLADLDSQQGRHVSSFLA
jgi:hypothetical protein